MKRGSFKASEVQPGHIVVAAASVTIDDEEGGGGDFGFVAPAPPVVGGGKDVVGTLPEGMFFIGVGVFMMERSKVIHCKIGGGGLAVKMTQTLNRSFCESKNDV